MGLALIFPHFSKIYRISPSNNFEKLLNVCYYIVRILSEIIMSGLKLSDITKIYDSGTTALYNVNLETADKEFIVLVGGEKCGKSTLLRVIAGLEEPTDGKVYIDGKDITEKEPKDRNIAMVFKGDSLYPTLTVFENMAYGLRIRKAPQALIEQRVKSAAAILGLTEVLYRKPKVLSSAARQRVAIGRAIVREPRLYLLDEPLSGLDEKLRLDMLNIIINLQARMQGTFVYATKNLSEALTIGTRIVVMKDGLVQQIDTPANLYDYPANTYVAFYIGSPTINFLQKAKIVKEEDVYFAVCGDIRLAIPSNIVSRFEKIDEYAGSDKTVIVGIRPEDINISAEGEIAAQVGKVEKDGETSYAECAAGGQTLLVSAAENTAKGDEVKLLVDVTKLYIFDSETRLTLLGRDGGYKNTGFADADRVPLPYPEEQAVIENLKPKKDEKKKKLR